MTAIITIPQSLSGYIRRMRRTAYFKQTHRSGIVEKALSCNPIYLSNAKLAKLTEAIGWVDTADTLGNFIAPFTRSEGAALLICEKLTEEGRLNTNEVPRMIPPPLTEAARELHGRFAAISVDCARESGGGDYCAKQRNTKEIVSVNLSRRITRNQQRRARLVKQLVQNPQPAAPPTAFTDICGVCNDQVEAWKSFGRRKDAARYCQTRLGDLRVHRR